MTGSGNGGRRQGWVLVGVQGLLFLAVAVGAVIPGPTLFVSLAVGLGLVVLGAAGVLWAARDLGGALTPNPVPNGAGLVARGVYARVRHPMYVSLGVVCLGVAVGSGSLLSYCAVAALAVFFAVKARVEERGLVATYPGYAEYGERVGRFFPGVGRLRGTV
jgi:protein-S-isoprenylcysteine O-methyltransferase Ste14